jgi:hypothetical protein
MLTTKQLLKLVLLLIGVALAAELLVFCCLNKASIYNEFITLDLVPKPEKLTELYFNDNANLPSSVTSNQTIGFSFVIHNLETTDYLYTYEVSVNARGTRRIVDSGHVLVKNNQYYVKSENIHSLPLPGRQKVVVELTNKQQSIDFWIRSITQ